ncbi:hypothetical protein SAMN05216303_106392 [Rhodoferax sp. OV413]|uniref:TraB/GumN family protein n=1 Tax=Rhodoferax sp. OV413 TaxID=1855285 RepID=UPI00087E04C0|nr:TraB/GumN family protein [Rhodoferax sp. OV413]SDP74919.1 hypothetical protein SAMN05216303_106392 [Rhodoferax sp. OV413]
MAPLLAWAQPSSADEPPADCASRYPPLVATPDSPVRDRGFLWRISKGGHTSYLYGTLHIGKPEWAQPGPQTQAALDASQQLALEMDTVPATIQALMAGLARQPDQVLAPTLEARLRQAIAQSCLPPALSDMLAPEMQVTMLAIGMLRADGYSGDWGADFRLAAIAHARAMPVVGLEKPQDQVRLLLATNAEDRNEGVQEQLDDMASGKVRRITLRMVRMWDEADYATLQRYKAWCECAPTNERERRAMKALLDDRNLGMAQAIDRLHGQGTAVFAAVGSLHMVGPTGLPAWMARHGYRVQRVAFGRAGKN